MRYDRSSFPPPGEPRVGEEPDNPGRFPTLLLALLMVTGSTPVVATAAPPSTHYTGTLPDGGTWVADVPARWNGTLVLFSHGFGTPEAIDAPTPKYRSQLGVKGSGRLCGPRRPRTG